MYFTTRCLVLFHVGSCVKDQRSGTVIPTKEESAFSSLQADSSQARNDPFATFIRLTKPQHNKSRGLALAILLWLLPAACAGARDGSVADWKSADAATRAFTLS